MASDLFQASANTAFAKPMLHPEQPKLIVLEGIDLSGRTTQVQLLHDWLAAQNYHVTTTAWRTSPLISDLLARARTGPPLQPLTYSLLFCADHVDRTQRVIKPALERGEIVLADRYTYTAFARDAARGLDPTWVRNLYHFSVQPDVVFYLHISPEEAVKRRLALQQQRQNTAGVETATPGKTTKDAQERKQHKPKPKEQAQAALATTVQLSGEALESFRNFENRMYSEYQQMQKEFGFSVIEGDKSIDHVQAMLRRAITQLLLNIG
ncbi:MAG TPA: dTMP kinase [Ktedonobacteraceae bacterium]|nr:dTMP kinase [Ktedonobacteraceae bacterium]